MKRIITSIFLVLFAVTILSSCGENNSKKIIGRWVSPQAENQKLEILTEEIRFNYRRFDYSIKGNVLFLKETFPNKSIVGEMPFELNGDSLIIDLGTEFEGYFYGRSGKVYLERIK